MEERDTDWERAHLIGWKWCEGGRHRLRESALDSGREWVEKRDTDWERAHLIGWEWCGGEILRLGESALESGRQWCEVEICELGESALDRVRMVWGREIKTGRERT